MKKLIVPALIFALVMLACSVPASLQPTTKVPQVTATLPVVTAEATATAPEIPGQTPLPPMVTLTVYFMDVAHYQTGIEPYEAPVERSIPKPDSLPEAVLTQLFLGPTSAEQAQGLGMVLSGSTGFSQLTIENGIARVYLTGVCNSGGATYTIASLIGANLKQFPEIQWVKIYDQNGQTEMPEGQSSSIPFCLEP